MGKMIQYALYMQEALGLAAQALFFAIALAQTIEGV